MGAEQTTPITLPYAAGPGSALGVAGFTPGIYYCPDVGLFFLNDGKAWRAQNVAPPQLMRTGAIAETFDRSGPATNAGILATGRMQMTRLWIPGGVSIGHIGVVSSGTAAGTPTHWWFGLYDLNLVQLAVTADQLTAAWAASTEKSLAIATTAAGAASSFTTTYPGLYYIGVSVTATTVPTLNCLSLIAALNSLAPVLGGNSSTQSAPAAFPFTATALTPVANLFYAYVAP